MKTPGRLLSLSLLGLALAACDTDPAGPSEVQASGGLRRNGTMYGSGNRAAAPSDSMTTAAGAGGEERSGMMYGSGN
ncbi:MAG TPA: hypothetical protein VFX98_00575 [Longimicrobiaceae bacterium]|nr:hypothetical protein [Longimicrobiaceae bacterium]